MDKFIKSKIQITTEKLKEFSEKKYSEIEKLDCKELDRYKEAGEFAEVDDSWGKLDRFDRIGGRDKHYWVHSSFKTPKIMQNEAVELEVITGFDGGWDATNPQGLIYLNGVVTQGVDINHRRVLLEPDKEYDVMMYFYSGMIEKKVEVNFNIIIKNKDVEKLYYDMKVPYDAAMCFKEDDYSHIITIKHLEAACNILNLKNPCSKEFYESVNAAEKYLQDEYFKKECGKSDVIVNYIGHTHIDVAWLWTLDQTREKTQRSFSTVLNLMEQYPEYVFMSSQPQLYEYLKEEEPTLYEKVKERVKEGRWEVEGAMWLEADCNLSSGESLIRQIIYGKRFMLEEFGVESKVLWLPDVFGYSAALPQILKKSGVDKFVTSKISWNESNKMPYDAFLWEGVDGTDIFTYFLTAQTHEDALRNETFTTYVGTVSPQMHLGTWERFQQKEYNNEAIVTFGHGDGGGGPTAEMIETQRRLEYGLPGMPKSQMSFAGDFLNRVEENFNKNCELTKRVPRWVGELYLEFHRGTYTSIAKNKKNNRDCEFLCQTTETVAVADEVLLNGEYPKEVLHDSWKTILLNQFHDIIPGSSIFEVYENSDKQYAKLRDEVGKVKAERMKAIAENVDKSGIFVYNPNSFEASGYVKNGDDTIYVKDVPALGWKVIDKACDVRDVTVSDKKIETPHYVIVFDDKMNISSIFDKDCGREVLANGKGNRLALFEDYPRNHDNWEISSYYKQKTWDLDDVTDVEQISGNGYGGFRVIRKYMNSTVSQEITAYSENRRIDFKTNIDWHEHHVVLKAVFPVDIHSNKATYEIQFGNVERTNNENTSWDAAKFEVCAQKWCDLSEDGYGVSILNDCKYGHSILGNEMSITLLKCGTYPNPEADQGMHEFTYSLLPHEDDFKRGGTINEAYLLNRPLEAYSAKGKGNIPSEYSLVSCDCENIVIETVKKSEDNDAVIVRLYDAWNRKSTPTIKLGFEAKEIALCDMMENTIKELGDGNEVKIDVSNFEIVTLKIKK